VALNVGFAGHRPCRLPQDHAPLAEQLTATLERIARCFAQIAALPETAASHDLGVKPVLRLLSPLAEGADRIAADSALAVAVPCGVSSAPELGYELHCPLPFPIEEYRKDFEARENHPNDTCEAFDALLQKIHGNAHHRILELDGSRESEGGKKLAYWKAGRFLLRHSDILLAVWDGEEDKTSVGTAGVVAHAERSRGPAIRILAAAPHSVEFRDPELTGNAWVALADADLDERLRRLILPPDLLPKPAAEVSAASPAERVCANGLPEKHGSSSDADPLRLAYFNHAEPQLTFMAWGYRLFFALFGKRDYRLRGLCGGYKEGAEYQWNAVEQALAKLPKAAGGEAPVTAELNGAVKEHFIWADQLATYYADEYRGTYSLMFSLASLAVVLALLSGHFGVFGQWFGAAVAGFMPWLAFGELLVIGCILGLWWRSHKQQFHERWLNFIIGFCRYRFNCCWLT
jgi:hypothetical protein